MSTWNESLLTAGSTEMPHGKDDVSPDLCSETEEHGCDQCLSVLAVCASVILWTIWCLEASWGNTSTRKSFKMANPQLVLTCWDEYSIVEHGTSQPRWEIFWHALLAQSSPSLGKSVEGIFKLHKA